MVCSGLRVLVCTLAVGLLGGASWAVNIETVPVGNPGNAGNSRHYPFSGSVGHTYNIGKYEVTAGQYCEFLNAVAKTDTYGLYNEDMWESIDGCKIQRTGSSGSYMYSVASDYANRPVNFVSWGDAARFANWLHNGQSTGPQDLTTTEDGAYFLNGATSNTALLAVTRKSNWKWAIPTEHEWYKAAYHKNDGVTGNYWDYPTSSDSVPGRDLNDVSGNNANYRGDPYPIQSPYYTTVVGEFENSPSPYGTFDQGGNVSEWSETLLFGWARLVQGGSFSFGSDVMHAWTRGGVYHPSFERSDIGFRVCQVPEPASLVILALGFGVLVRRR